MYRNLSESDEYRNLPYNEQIGLSNLVQDHGVEMAINRLHDSITRTGKFMTNELMTMYKNHILLLRSLKKSATEKTLQKIWDIL